MCNSLTHWWSRYRRCWSSPAITVAVALGLGDAILLAQGTPFKVEAGSQGNSLVVSDAGGAGNPSYIGLGTDDPQAHLHITGSQQIFFDNEAGQDWQIDANSVAFNLRDGLGGSAVLTIHNFAPPNSLYLGGAGVGVGTNDPQQPLHVTTGSATVGIRLEETSGTAQRWDVEADDSGLDFRDVTNGDFPVLTLETGTFRVGIGDETPDADLDIERVSGMVTTFSRVNAGDMNFTTSSSRDLKENIEPLSVAGLLNRVATVPVCTYDWKGAHLNQQPETMKNKLGLIAEEFHSILGRGSDKEINGQDVQMVLWLAVQQLHRENQDLQGEVAELRKLKAERAVLEARLDRVEALLSSN